MDKIIVAASGIGLIGLIYWFFFGKKDEAVMVKPGGVDIVVDGGYKPATIKIKKGTDTKLTFLRRDPNSCLEEVVFPDFKIKEYLPMEKPVTINLNPKKSGTFNFHCGMN